MLSMVRRYSLLFAMVLYLLFHSQTVQAVDPCKEHIIQTDPITMTGIVNMDPYNRKEKSATMWSVEQEVYMPPVSINSKSFEMLPEGKYVFQYDGKSCAVSVELHVSIVSTDDYVEIFLPCQGETFEPVPFDVIANDYYTTQKAIRTLPVTAEGVSVEIIEAPSFVSSVGSSVWVNLPSDTLPGQYKIRYRLKDEHGMFSEESTSTIVFIDDCPEIIPEREFERVVLDVPPFFTPNDDGVNDEWLIPGLDTLGRFRVDLYDRSGKMIWRNDNISVAWDGTNNGRPMPSQDYWYIIYLFDADTTFKGHVTLIR